MYFEDNQDHLVYLKKGRRAADFEDAASINVNITVNSNSTISQRKKIGTKITKSNDVS